MSQDVVNSLVNEYHISEELAARATSEANGELENARRILDSIVPKYLFIKVRYLENNHEKGGGIILIGLEKNTGSFLLFRTLVDQSKDTITNIDYRLRPDYLYTNLKNYFAKATGASVFHDSEDLRNKLSRHLKPMSLNQIFHYGNSRKIASIEESFGISDVKVEPEPQLDTSQFILRELFTKVLGEVLFRGITVAADYDLMTVPEFEAVREALDLEDVSKHAPEVKKQERKEYKPDIILKGQLIIDPIEGCHTMYIKEGDRIYCDIVDRTEIATVVVDRLGLRKQGFWKSAIGRIVEITDTSQDLGRFRIQIAKGVYVIAPVLKNVKIKTFKTAYEIREEARAAETQVANPMPLLIGVILVAALVMILIMLR